MRLEHVETSLSGALDRAREEIASLRASLAEATSNSHFHEHRTGTLEAALKSAQQAYETASNRRAEMEGLLIAQQKEGHAREETIMQLNDALREAQERSRQAIVQAEVSKASEERLVTQLAELREELKRQSALSESVYRIEASLANRMQEEREGLQTEVESLQHSLDKVRRENSETVMMYEQKVQTQEEELRISRGSVEQQAQTIATLREDIAREKGFTSTAQERAALLEKQLTIAQDRLSAIQGVHTADSILAAENAQREVDLDKARSECEVLRAQLEASERHAEQYRKISASTESLLKELRERFSAARAAYEEELSALKGEVESMRNEMAERRQSLMESVREADDAREALIAASKKHDEEVSELRSELELAKEAQARAEQHMGVLKSDTAVFEASAKEATSNYERELAMHAQAAAELRKAESVVESLQAELTAAKQRTGDVTATCIRAERALEEEKQRANSLQQSLRDEVAALRHTNDLLHSQVQTMSAQVSRLQNERMKRAGVEDDKTEEGEGTVGGEDTGDAGDELTELRQAAAELRDVVKYMKRERDMLEAKLSLTETEKNRYIAELTSTQKALDEARAELKRAMESRSHTTARSEDEFAKLMQEITQLNVVRESNAHLRSENVQLKNAKDELQRNLNAARDELSPLNEKIIRLEANLQSMEVEKAALLADGSYWKDRLHQLVSRYNDVDPEDHRELKEKLRDTEATVTELREKVSGLESELEESKANLDSAHTSLRERTTELSAARSTAAIMEKNSESLRARLRDFTKQIKDQKTQIAQLVAAAKENEDKVQALQKELELAKTAPAAPPTETAVASTVPASTAAATPSTAPAAMARKNTLVQPAASATPATAPTALSTQKDASSAPSEPTSTVPPAATAAATTTTTAPHVDTSAAAAHAADLKSLREDLLRRMAAKKSSAAPAATTAAAKHAAPAEDDAETPHTKRARTTAATPAAAAETPAPATAPPPQQAPSHGGPTPKKCYYFTSAKGCRKGDACPFLHETETPVTAPAPAPEATAKPEVDTTIVTEEPVDSATGSAAEPQAAAVHEEATSQADEVAATEDDMEEAALETSEGVEGRDTEESPGTGSCAEDVTDIDAGGADTGGAGGEGRDNADKQVTSVDPDVAAADPSGSSAAAAPPLSKFLRGSPAAVGPFSKSVKTGPAVSKPSFGSTSGSIFGAGFKTSTPAAGGASSTTPTTGSNIFGSLSKKAAPMNPFARPFAPQASAAAPAEQISSSTSQPESEGTAGDFSAAPDLPVPAPAAEESSPPSRTQSSSPFVNLRPPSPNSNTVRLQFGSAGPKSLPVPANLPSPSSASSATAPFKGFGSSLFKVASAAAPTSGASAPSDLSSVGQPVRVLPVVVAKAQVEEPTEYDESEEGGEESSNVEDVTEATQEQATATIVSTKVSVYD